mgnify:FL=1
MTVSSQTNKIIYIGNGVAKEFAIPFSFLEQKHIKVRQKENDIQTERTDWEINGGNIVFKTAPESGAEIAIVREVPLTQETDYRDNEILHAETLERNFDKLTMQVQQLEEKSARAVTVDIFDDTAAASLIPSIRKAVSDCQTAVETTAANAQTATGQARLAQSAADSAATSETNTAAMLGTKADVDLVNLTRAGKENLADMLMPDYSRKVVLTAGVTYTASCAGVFCGYYRGSTGTGTTYTVNGFTQTYAAGFDDNSRPSGASFFVFVSKGESYSAARANNLYFIPLKGVAA